MPRSEMRTTADAVTIDTYARRIHSRYIAHLKATEGYSGSMESFDACTVKQKAGYRAIAEMVLEDIENPRRY